MTRFSQYCELHMPNMSYQDFAYQAALSFPGGREGGLTFRVDEIQDECYIFWCGNSTVWAQICNLNTFSVKEEILGFTKVKENGSTSLLAIVAQGTVLDFYVDLKHIKRVNVRFITSGSIGIIDQSPIMEVRYTKLWVKNK